MTTRFETSLATAPLGSALVDRDGQVWVLWPNGAGGVKVPNVHVDVLRLTATFGPFHVIRHDMSDAECNHVAAQRGNAARIQAATQPWRTPLDCQFGVESIDGPFGLRAAASH